MTANFLYCIVIFLLMHVCVWFSTNLQLVSSAASDKSLLIAICLAVPTTLLAYFGTKFGYQALGESAWGVRFFAFAISYVTFPFLTWWFLGESMFTMKTMLCIALSFLIMAIQVYL